MSPPSPSVFSELPTGFFARTFSSMSLEITSFFWAILASFWATTASNLAIRESFGRLGRLGLPALLDVEHVGAVLDQCRLPPVDLAGLEPVLVTDGVFVPAAAAPSCDAPPAFIPARPMTRADLAPLTERVRSRRTRTV